MTETITELLTRLSATGRVVDEPDWAAIRKRAAAHLTPAELAATRAAILEDARKRGISPAVRNAADRLLFMSDDEQNPPSAGVTSPSGG